MKIRFSWNGKNYEVGMDAYENNKIVLPDGTLLRAGLWIETLPPKPRNLCEVPHPFSSVSATEVARQTGAELAKEIK